MDEEVTTKSSKKPIIIGVGIFVFIALTIIFIIVKQLNDKDYTLEEVTEFSYYKLCEDKKYGVIDTNGNILVPPTYEMVDIPNPSKAVFIGYFTYNSDNMNENKTEVINDKNEKILTQYETVLPLMFKDALVDIPYEKSVLAFKENGKYGIIDYTGKKITNADYDSIESLLYKEGCLLVKQNDKYGLITMTGKTIMAAEYDSIIADGYYDEETKYKKAGFIVSKKDEKGYHYGYINSNGDIILDTQFNEIDRVTDIDDNTYLVAFRNGQAGLYQAKRQLVKHAYEAIEYDKTSGLFITEKDAKQGLVDKDGNELLKTEYDEIQLSEEKIRARKDGNIYYFNKQGKELKNVDQETYTSVKDNTYKVTIDDEYMYGVKSKKGQVILENKYTYIEYAYGDYFITTKDGIMGVYDAKENKEVISNNNVIQKIEGKDALQVILQDNYTTELYNNKMEKVVSMKEATLSITKDYIKVYSKNERKYFDNQGNEISNDKLFPNLSLYAFSENGKWGFKDATGKVVVEAKYDMVTEMNSYGYAGIEKNNKWGIINSQGEIIVEPKYKIDWQEPEFIKEYYKLNYGYGMIYYTKDL